MVPGTFCSLRWGELAALTRDAVDLDRRVVHVRVTLVELADGRLLTGPPRSAAGRRVVAIPPSLLPVAATHLDRFVGPESSALVFTGATGAALRRSNFQKHRVAAVEAAGVPPVHFHGRLTRCSRSRPTAIATGEAVWSRGLVPREP